jgi:hypothetical protein
MSQGRRNAGTADIRAALELYRRADLILIAIVATIAAAVIWPQAIVPRSATQPRLLRSGTESSRAALQRRNRPKLDLAGRRLCCLSSQEDAAGGGLAVPEDLHARAEARTLTAFVGGP